MAFESTDGLVFTSRRVMYDGWPILLVTHDTEDEAWQFVNGSGDTDDDMQIMLVHPEHVIELDSSVRELADLPPGWRAWRPEPGAEWTREPQPPD
jgi:hypothetical protein